MRSLLELLEAERDCVVRIEDNDRLAERISRKIDELKANPFECDAKFNDIEREYKRLEERGRLNGCLQNELVETRKAIREYLMVIMNGPVNPEKKE